MRGSFSTVNLIDVQYKDNIKQTLLYWKKIITYSHRNNTKTTTAKKKTKKTKKTNNPTTGLE